MMLYLPLFVIALAVSLDGCGVGLHYGARNIRIPAVSMLIISICSGIVIWLSMKAGSYISRWIDTEIAGIAGALILVAIGIWSIVQFFMHRRERVAQTNDSFIHILRSPAIADIDKSGNISPWEASLLGLALSLDALGAGIGAALVGYSALPTAISIACSTGCFLAVGLAAGKRAAKSRLLRKMTVLPGFLLIAIGILKLM